MASPWSSNLIPPSMQQASQNRPQDHLLCTQNSTIQLTLLQSLPKSHRIRPRRRSPRGRPSTECRNHFRRSLRSLPTHHDSNGLNALLI
ncbi:hypothetical protein PIB30_073484, partial [Stylosanthes scabra]|nr:hypothetical protein [Stylosanthes scabra]